MKLQELNGRYFVTMPKALIEGLSWKKGANLKVEIGKDRTIIIKGE
jgi:antitoxin component of MazEF toxin-antitoxin module